MADTRNISENDPRKGPPERRRKERRKNWALYYHQRTPDFWRFESLSGRRSNENDRRVGAVNRRKRDRRAGNERRQSERRGVVPIKKPTSLISETPADVLEARIATGGRWRQPVSHSGHSRHERKPLTNGSIRSHAPSEIIKSKPDNTVDVNEPEEGIGFKGMFFEFVAKCKKLFQ